MFRFPPATSGIVVAVTFLTGACTGNISGLTQARYVDADGDGKDDLTGVEIPPDELPAANAGHGGAAEGGTGGTTPALRCDLPAAPLPAPIARLTNQQYRNTLSDLLPGVTLPALRLPTEIRRKDGFFNQADAQNPSSEFLEAWSANAEAIAAAAVIKLAQLVPCAQGANQADCGNTWVEAFGRKAFRRTLSTAERSRYRKLLSDVTITFGFSEGIALTLRAFLQSPHFLYRPEFGEPMAGTNGRKRLTAFELGTRLSYFFWGTMPDESLQAAASSGALLQDAMRTQQVQRLLSDDRARVVAADFHEQWLRLSRLDGLTKRPDLFPSFDARVAVDLKASLHKFLDQAFWQQGGTLNALLTSPTAYVNDRIAPFFDLPAPGSTALVEKQMDPSQRLGLLGQASLLSSLAHADVDSPTQRGIFVLEHLLCSPPPSPPGNVNTEPPKAVAGTPTTTRERLEKQHLSSATCKACHELIDGVGFGFNHFDAVGKWRTTENGLPIDASGVVGVGLEAETDINGAFDGLTALAKKMSTSQTAEICVGTHWLSYARGLAASDIDPCVVASLLPNAKPGHASLREFLVAIASSEEFLTRPEATP